MKLNVLKGNTNLDVIIWRILKTKEPFFYTKSKCELLNFENGIDLLVKRKILR